MGSARAFFRRVGQAALQRWAAQSLRRQVLVLACLFTASNATLYALLTHPAWQPLWRPTASLPLQDWVWRTGLLAALSGLGLFGFWATMRLATSQIADSARMTVRQIAYVEQQLARHKAILATAADAILSVAEDGTITSINPAAERLFGRSPAELLGRPLTDLLTGVTAQSLSTIMAEGMWLESTQSRLGQAEVEGQRWGGTPFPAELLVGETAHDRSIRYACIVRDLSEMRQAESYMMLYSRALDCSMNGVMISNAQRYPQPLVYVNPAFTRITGYQPFEVLGRDASVLEGPLTSVESLRALSDAVRHGREATLTLVNYRKDGQTFYNKLSVSPVSDADGRITHYINIIEDVTEQAKAEQALRARTARLDATFDLSPDGFLVFDEQGVLSACNPAMQDMVGLIPQQCRMADFDLWFRSLCADEAAYPPIARSDSAGKCHLQLKRPQPKAIDREVRRNPSGSGETIVYFRDVTLETEVDRMKSEFLATAAHELRTPLASILGYAELMLHRQYKPEQQRDMLQTIHRQSSLLTALIGELLDLARIEARRGKDFHIVAVPLSQLVEDAVKAVGQGSAHHRVRVGPIPALSVMADATKVQQAIINLLGNALKFSGPDQPVELETCVHGAGADAKVDLLITDHGIGMTPAQLERVFERFYRADASGNVPGTGLGLNLVKEIAEVHGGEVQLRSQAGQGSTAILRLCVAAEGLGTRADTKVEENTTI